MVASQFYASPDILEKHQKAFRDAHQERNPFRSIYDNGKVIDGECVNVSAAGDIELITYTKLIGNSDG